MARKKKADDMVTRETIDFALKRPATDHEAAEAGRALSRLLKEKDDEQEAEASRRSDYKARMDELETRETTAREAVDEGVVRETVKAERSWDLRAARVTTVRLDTGEVVEDRAMLADELEARRQMRLDIAPADPLARWADPCGCIRLSEGGALERSCQQHCDHAVDAKEGTAGTCVYCGAVDVTCMHPVTREEEGICTHCSAVTHATGLALPGLVDAECADCRAGKPPHDHDDKPTDPYKDKKRERKSKRGRDAAAGE